MVGRSGAIFGVAVAFACLALARPSGVLFPARSDSREVARHFLVGVDLVLAAAQGKRRIATSRTSRHRTALLWAQGPGLARDPRGAADTAARRIQRAGVAARRAWSASGAIPRHASAKPRSGRTRAPNAEIDRVLDRSIASASESHAGERKFLTEIKPPVAYAAEAVVSSRTS